MAGIADIRRDLAICIGFLTRIPVATVDPAERSLGGAIWAAPIAGVIVGLAGGIVYAIGWSLGFPSFVVAALTVAATIVLTGGLHEDGLSDSADGFGGGSSRERKLEIMHDSRIGSYGALAIGLSLLLRIGALAALADPGQALAALVAAHAASRALVPCLMAWLPPARSDGLAGGAGSVDWRTARLALVLSAIALLAIGHDFLPGAIALALVFFAFAALCRRQIGGHTGDTLGALQQLAEIAVLVVASAAAT